MGARIVLVARDRSRGEGTLARLREKAPGLAHTVHYADLTRISEMKRVAAEVAEAEPRIDVLVNNAGAMFSTRKLTEDGLEYTFALNHMAYFVVTQGLRERLVASAPARVVSTASTAHQGARLDFDDLQLAKSFRAMKAYDRSKLCNILFTREHGRRLRGTGVTANSSRLRRRPLRRRKRRLDLALRRARQAFGDLPGEGRGNDHLSRVFAQDRRDDGPIFLQVPPDCAVAGGAGRQDCVIALGAQRGVSGPECVDASRWDCTLEPLKGTNRQRRSSWPAHGARPRQHGRRGDRRRAGRRTLRDRRGSLTAFERMHDMDDRQKETYGWSSVRRS